MIEQLAARTVGVDVGGTFTDFVFVHPNGRMTVRKYPSTPADPSRSVLEGLQAARAEGLLASRFVLSHGTTVATNALLERRGAKTALITTRGFRDVLEIGRQARSSLYAFHPSRPVPLLAREQRVEVTERLDWQGRVITALDEAEAAELLESLANQGIESVAVCFLFSYLNAEHERQAGEMARERGFAVSLSSEIAPEPREFERACTTVANAFVMPVLSRYLTHLEEGAKAAGAAQVRIMQSNGGALSAQKAAAQAVKTALSGPAGGIIAAAHIGAEAGLSRLMSFDMGGTSTDVALIVDGECPVVTTAVLGGLPLRTPMLDIHTVGAGGGSLAWLDAAGGLRVGPQSAGADPGPAAYGRGDGLTVTDANVLLGRLPADLRLADQLSLDAERVRALFTDFARQLACSPEEAALGITQIVETAMARALRHTSVERGHDPNDFTLLSFGGAGGLHACALAQTLGMRQALIPRYPGALSALGLAIAPILRETVRAFPARVLSTDSSEVWEELKGMLSEMEPPAWAELKAEMDKEGECRQQVRLDMRYVGQSFELQIPTDLVSQEATVQAFHNQHRARYGHADMSEPVEATALRLTVTGVKPAARLRFPSPARHASPLRETRVYSSQGWTEAAIFRREELAEGQAVVGPALFVQSDATTFLPEGWQSTTDAYGNLRLITLG